MRILIFEAMENIKCQEDERVAQYRSEYFKMFIGVKVQECDKDKYPSGWMGYSPEEAMELADKVVSWILSSDK